jgi:hypothetical protein
MRRRDALALAVALALVGAWRVLGLERIVLRTGLGSEHPAETSLWVADDGFDLWIEAPDSERGWYGALLADPLVEVRRSGRTERFRADPVPGARRHVERLYREKYGFAQVLRRLVSDRRRAIPIRLARLPDPGTRA